MIYVAVHICRVPKKLDNDRELREKELSIVISERDQTIAILSTKPKRTPAEQHDYDTVKKALQLLGKRGLIAMRHIRNHGSLTFGTYSPVLPPGLNLDDTLRVYAHCASEGLVTQNDNHRNNERTYAVSPKLEKVLDELLYEDTPTPATE